MRINTTPLDHDLTLNLNLIDIKKEHILLLDIETTGFSRIRNQIYLIGCIFQEEGIWQLRQWLSESLMDEPEILSSFIAFIKDYELIVHYNGNIFDLPFISERCTNYDIIFDKEKYKSLDIYEKIKPFRKVLRLSNLKLKTLEQYVGINREDLYSGGDLIGQYYHFVRSKDEQLKELLLLHNKEDLLGLLQLIPFIQYDLLLSQLINAPQSSCYIDDNENQLLLSIEHSYTLPKPIHYHNHLFSLECKENSLILSIPYINEELKFFFDNYKEYYYLPEEDQSIHKSIASFVHGPRKEKAKASNCCIKKRGNYLPLNYKMSVKLFKKDYLDTMYYILLEDVLQSEAVKREYLTQLLRHL